MNSHNNVFKIHFDIVNNIITDEYQKTICIDAIKYYEPNQPNTEDNTELIRFARHIVLDNYFSNVNSASNTSNNIDNILKELSFSSEDSSNDDDTILLLQLSSTLDSFLSKLSLTDKNIYLYRYFFAYSIEDIANLVNTQPNNVQKTLSQCNSKLSNSLKENSLIANCKSLILSFADIDDNHLLSLIHKDTCDKKSISSDDLVCKKRKFTLKLCLNIIIGIVLAFLIGLNIYQYISSIDGASTDSSNKNNSEDINIDDFFIYDEEQKIVNINKLLEYATYATDEYPPFDYTINNYTANYDAYIVYDTIPLSEFVGEEIPELAKNYASYYKLIGIDSYQYIIYKNNDGYVLYSSGYLYPTEDATNNSIENPIPYKETLSSFHSIDDPSDITEIRIMAGDTNTGYADSFTSKVIDHEEDIKLIYNTITNTAFKGNTVYKLFDEGIIDYDYLMDNSVHIIIYGKNSIYMDRLLYCPERNLFFDITNYVIYETDSVLDDTLLNFQELIRFYVHKTEPIDPELWLYSIRCATADPMYLSINIQCGPQANNKGKYVGSDYTLQKIENNKWVELPILDEYADIPRFLFHQKLDPSSSATNLDIHFVNKYGYLQPGMYRLTLTVYDIYSEDINNPVSKDYVMDFQIN